MFIFNMFLFFKLCTFKCSCLFILTDVLHIPDTQCREPDYMYNVPDIQFLKTQMSSFYITSIPLYFCQNTTENKHLWQWCLRLQNHVIQIMHNNYSYTQTIHLPIWIYLWEPLPELGDHVKARVFSHLFISFGLHQEPTECFLQCIGMLKVQF